MTKGTCTILNNFVKLSSSINFSFFKGTQQRSLEHGKVTRHKDGYFALKDRAGGGTGATGRGNFGPGFI